MHAIHTLDHTQRAYIYRDGHCFVCVRGIKTGEFGRSLVCFDTVFACIVSNDLRVEMMLCIDVCVCACVFVCAFVYARVE